MFRATLLGWLATTMVVVACSGQGSQSSGDSVYAEEMAELLVTMQTTLTERVAETQSSPPSIEAMRVSIDGQLMAIDDFLGGFRSLEPPAAFSDDHARAEVVVQDLRDATKTLADIVHSVDTLAEMEVTFQGAPLVAIEEASERAWEMCRRAQDAFGGGVERAIEFASPWLQASATEHIEVNLRCFIG